MPQSIRAAKPVNNVDALTPHHINAEVSEFIGTMHQLDRDNFPTNEIDPAKVAIDAFGVIEFDVLENLGITTTISSQESNQQVFPIVNNTGSSGEPWRMEIVTQDGALELELSATHQVTSGAAAAMWMGLLVDGHLVGKTPWMTGPIDTNLEGNDIEGHRQGTLNCACPVSAGTHVIEAVFALHNGSSSGSAWNMVIEWGARLMWAREVRR